MSLRVNGGVVGLLSCEVVVDALDEDVDVVQDGRALGAGCEQDVGLLRDLVLGLLARLEVLQPGDEADRVEPRRADRGNARVVAGLREEQAAIRGSDPAGGPDAVVVGGAGDVRDVVGVADDRHARTRDVLDRRRRRVVDAEASPT